MNAEVLDFDVTDMAKLLAIIIAENRLRWRFPRISDFCFPNASPKLSTPPLRQAHVLS
jgi:hypothetical protein